MRSKDPTGLTDRELRELIHMHLKTLIGGIAHVSQDGLVALLARCTMLAWRLDKPPSDGNQHVSSTLNRDGTGPVPAPALTNQRSNKEN
jgi:hypothetical protein